MGAVVVVVEVVPNLMFDDELNGRSCGVVASPVAGFVGWPAEPPGLQLAQHTHVLAEAAFDTRHVSQVHLVAVVVVVLNAAVVWRAWDDCGRLVVPPVLAL